MEKKRRTIRHPSADDSWKQDFGAATFRTNFNLQLSQAMIEMLCALADGVHWDRSQFGGLHRPDNWLATQAALRKRGLAVPKTEEERERMRRSKAYVAGRFGELSYWKLTPAGDALVDLFRVAGIFVEADNAITKRLRNA